MMLTVNDNLGSFINCKRNSISSLVVYSESYLGVCKMLVFFSFLFLLIILLLFNYSSLALNTILEMFD